MRIYKVSRDEIERDRIIDLVERVKKGHTNWDLEEQQLYQNNVKEIEGLLRGEI